MTFKTAEERRAYHREWYRKNKAVRPWRDVGDMRKCTRCGKLKPRTTAFPKLPHARLGYASACQACKNERSKGRAPTWTGLTREQYQKHVREGFCFICNENKPRMAVDHCHVTQVKRGVLCPACNKGLGHFKDNPGLLEAALAYLRR